MSDRLREWADAIDGASLRAIRRARPKLLRARGARAIPAALCLARLAQADDVPRIAPLLRAALRTATGTADEGRLALALATHGDATDDTPALLERARGRGDVATASLAELRRARNAQRRGALDEARRMIDALRARGAQSDFVGANLDVVDAIQHLGEGHKSRARELLERAFRWVAGHDADFEASEVAGMIGNVAHDVGDLDAAIRWYGFAMRHAARAGSRATIGIFSLYEGWALHERGRRAAAKAAYARARRALGGDALRRFRLQCDALAALVGTTLEGRVVVARAATALAELGDHARANAVTTLGIAADATEAGATRSLPAAVLGALRCRRALDRAPVASDDERIARRMAELALDRAEARIARRRAVIAIADDGSRVRVGARTIALVNHKTHARIVVALAEATLEGRKLTLAELVAIGWPGERIREDAAVHRVHVALSTLRSRGLGSILPRDAAGYALEAQAIGLLARRDRR